MFQIYVNDRVYNQGSYKKNLIVVIGWAVGITKLELFSTPLKLNKREPHLASCNAVCTPHNLKNDEKFAVKRDITRRLKRWGGSRILLFSRDRTLTTCEWMAQETQYCNLV